MLQVSVIVASYYSPFIYPSIAVIKKNGELRLCLDAREANDFTIPDYQQNKTINELLSQGENCKYLSTIDLSAS